MDETRISAAGAIAATQALLDQLNGASPGYIQLRTGSAPSLVASPATGDLIGTCVLSQTAFQSPELDSSGLFVFANANVIGGISGAAIDGVAGWFRAFSGAGVAVIQGSVTGLAQGGAMQISKVNIKAGDVINVLSWQIIQPLG